jgi:hypothetical protein
MELQAAEKPPSVLIIYCDFLCKWFSVRTTISVLPDAEQRMGDSAGPLTMLY